MRRLLLSRGVVLARSRSSDWMSSGCSDVAFSMSVSRVCIAQHCSFLLSRIEVILCLYDPALFALVLSSDSWLPMSVSSDAAAERPWALTLLILRKLIKEPSIFELFKKKSSRSRRECIAPQGTCFLQEHSQTQRNA